MENGKVGHSEDNWHPWFFYLKDSQGEFWDKPLPKVQYLWTVDKITPSNLPIIFRLLKIVWKKSVLELEKDLSLCHQSSICKSTLGCCIPTFSHCLPVWSPSVEFSHSLGSSSTAPSTWSLPCFPCLELVVNSSLFSKHSVYYQYPYHSLYHDMLCTCIHIFFPLPCCLNKQMLGPTLQKRKMSSEDVS